MSSSDRNGSHGEQIKPTPAVNRLRKLSLQQRPNISELAQREISKKESHQSLTSLPTTSSHLSPRPDRRHIIIRPSSTKASPRFHSQRQHSDLDIRNQRINRQSKFIGCHSNRCKTALVSSDHGNSYQDDDDDNAVPSSARGTSRSNLLSMVSLSVDSLIDQWTLDASKRPNPLPPRPVGSEHFEAVLGEMTMAPRKEDALQGPPNMVAIKTVRISPLVQVTIGGSPRLQPKKRNK